MAREIALFGGTFDPVHLGHLIVARAVAERRGFERITFVPTAWPPHKQPALAAAEHRLAMLQLATRGDPLFDISRVELNRTAASYTYDTLADLRDEHGPEAKLYWIIGADMLADLHTWRRSQEVVELANIVVASRWPWSAKVEEVLTELAGSFRPEQVQRIRELVTETPLIDISSSAIRRRVADGQSIRNLVPDPVSSYVGKHVLYR